MNRTIGRHDFRGTAVVACSVFALAFAISSVRAGDFEPIFYKSCHTPVAQIEDFISSSKSQQNSGLLQNASTLVTKMRAEHPDANARWTAYGDKMADQRQAIERVRGAASQSHNCYETAYEDLGRRVKAGAIEQADAKRQLKEIRAGLAITGELLRTAFVQNEETLGVFNQAVGREAQELNVELSRVASETNRDNRFDTDFDNLEGLAGFSPARARSERDIAQTLANVAPAAGPNAAPNFRRAGQSSEDFLIARQELSELVDRQRSVEKTVKSKNW